MVEQDDSSNNKFYCNSCDAHISPHHAFCAHCGTHVASPTIGNNSPPSITTTQEQYPPPAPAAAPLRHSGVGIVSFVIACVSFVNCAAVGSGLLANLSYLTRSTAALEVLGILFILVLQRTIIDTNGYCCYAY